MANQKLEVRLAPIMHAYLQDLVDIGAGGGKGMIARRFIENGILASLETKLIAPRKAKEFGGDDDDD